MDNKLNLTTSNQSNRSASTGLPQSHAHPFRSIAHPCGSCETPSSRSKRASPSTDDLCVQGHKARKSSVGDDNASARKFSFVNHFSVPPSTVDPCALPIGSPNLSEKLDSIHMSPEYGTDVQADSPIFSFMDTRRNSLSSTPSSSTSFDSRPVSKQSQVPFPLDAKPIPLAPLKNNLPREPSEFKLKRSHSASLPYRRLFGPPRSSPASALGKVDENAPFQEGPANSLSSVSYSSHSVFADALKMKRAKSTGCIDDLARRFKQAASFVADSTKPTEPDYKCKLPLRPEHQNTGYGYKVISIDVVADVLRGKYDHHYDRIFIIDCRSTREFEGGHIRGALHKQQASELHHFFNEQTLFGDRTAFIFHCEFSKIRGPRGYTAMRTLDSKIHEGNGLCFPEVYLMKDGYCQFYEKYGGLCDPYGYFRQTPDISLLDSFH